jgi:hypothetical protein
MTQMPSSASGSGFAPQFVSQFSIFLENRVGRLLELVKTFDDQMVRICALAVHDSSDHAVIRLVTSNALLARETLRGQGLTYFETELLLVELGGDKTLARMCQFLLGAELNIRFSYPLMGWEQVHGGVIALAVDDPTLAAQILRRKEFRLLCEHDLPKYGD